MIKFEQTGRRPASSDASHADPRVAIDGEKLYRLIIDGNVIRENMTLDEVIAEIHRSDQEDHFVREPAAERRRMSRKEPGERR